VPIRTSTLSRGLVIDLEPLDFAATQLAALFVDGHAHTVFNGHTQLGKSAGVGEHQANADLATLGQGAGRGEQAGGRGAQEGCALGE
jgi:hypothetical protein